MYPLNKYQGNTYEKLSKEYDTFSKSPDVITPLELIEWALAVGQWDHVMTRGGSVWEGPCGKEAVINGDYMWYDRDEALETMKAHYKKWWAQRAYIAKAFDALNAAPEEKCCDHCINKMSEQEFEESSSDDDDDEEDDDFRLDL